MRRFVAIAHVLGVLLLMMSALYLIPIAWSLAVDDGLALRFVQTALGTVGVGLALWLPGLRSPHELQPRDGALLVVLSWVSMAAAGAFPLMLEVDGMSFTDAFFEAMSAFTTTGATVMTGLDVLPQSLNVWRHVMQWYGGMGLIVLAVAVLPMLGLGGMQLFKAEMPGLVKETKLTPRIAQTAKFMWLIYAGLTAICIVLLRLVGMDWYEAVCHGFSSMALGGFSTRDASVAGFNSIGVELVLMTFMLIGALNFATHFAALRGRSILPYLFDPEARWVWGFLMLAIGGLTIYLYGVGHYESFWTALREVAFNTVSIGTASGYASADFGGWPLVAGMGLMLLGAVTSSSGSVGGGIKMIRTQILLRQAARELLRMSHPRAVRPLVLNQQLVGNDVVMAVLGFMLLYGATMVLFTLLMLATGMDLVTAFSAVVACLNNIGPALGDLGPSANYAWLSDFQTWVLAFVMLAGRLELLTVFVLLTPRFWRR
jgi:trk system potassium uptake protein TrkH